MCCFHDGAIRHYSDGPQHDAHVRAWFFWTVMALVLFSPDKSAGSIERAIETVRKELREGKIDDHAARRAIGLQ